MPTNVLIIGQGGREHALAWKLARSPRIGKLYIAPGNAGTREEGENVPLAEDDLPGLVAFAKKQEIGLTVVGPEVPLVAGIVDQFRAAGLPIFGPSAAAARLEGSKIFCKERLREADIPTAAWHVFRTAESAEEYIDARCPPEAKSCPVVIKADGLAAGKGAIVCGTRQQAFEAISRIARKREFGSAGDKFLIEDRLDGEEVSVLAITDGRTLLVLPPAQDHKAAFDNDEGPNTGGMGAYSPAATLPDEMLRWVEEHVFVPTLHVMNKNGYPFTGVLYAGLMKTPQGPRVLEYNVRFGDPECQILMMRLESDLLEILELAAQGRLDQLESIQWTDEAAVGVVMASEGYPGPYPKGRIIRGLADAGAVPDVKVFHAGTTVEGEQVVTSGGRVLTVVGRGGTIPRAKRAAYEGVRKIRWDGAWCRKDISDKAFRDSTS